MHQGFPYSFAHRRPSLWRTSRSTAVTEAGPAGGRINQQHGQAPGRTGCKLGVVVEVHRDLALHSSVAVLDTVDGHAHFFSAHRRCYQALSAQAVAFHERFVQALTGAAGADAAAEAANASPLAALGKAALGGAFIFPPSFFHLINYAVTPIRPARPSKCRFTLGADRQGVGRRSSAERLSGESGEWVAYRTSADVCLLGHGGFTRTIGACPAASSLSPRGPGGDEALMPTLDAVKTRTGNRR